MGKLVEVFGTREGFDPFELPAAIREAGFMAPDADIGIEVEASGRLLPEEDGGWCFEVAGSCWGIRGDLPDPETGREGASVRVSGRLHAPESEGAHRILEVATWSRPPD